MCRKITKKEFRPLRASEYGCCCRKGSEPVFVHVPTAAKYPLPQRHQIFRKHLLEAYDRGKVFVYGFVCPVLQSQSDMARTELRN